MEAFSQHLETPLTQHQSSPYIRNHEYTTASGTAQLTAATEFAIYDLDQTSPSGTAVGDHVFQEGEFVCPGFFSRVSVDYFRPSLAPLEWSYDMRRDAQQILPFLYLGPSSLLRDLSSLSVKGFTLLLAVRSKQFAQVRLVSGQGPAARLGIEADTIDVMDGQELIAALPRAVRRINDHIASPGICKPCHRPLKKIFVFCESGNERSAIVVIAYVMVMFNIGFIGALNMIQQRRFSTSVGDKLRYLMMNFESILAAKRDVEASRRVVGELGSAIRSSPTCRKRRYSTLTTDGSQELAVNREPVVPFQDR